jgi:hypothetical protein
MRADTNRGSGRQVERGLSNATELSPATGHRLPGTAVRRGRVEQYPCSRWYLRRSGGL